MRPACRRRSARSARPARRAAPTAAGRTSPTGRRAQRARPARHMTPARRRTARSPRRTAPRGVQARPRAPARRGRAPRRSSRGSARRPVPHRSTPHGRRRAALSSRSPRHTRRARRRRPHRPRCRRPRGSRLPQPRSPDARPRLRRSRLDPRERRPADPRDAFPREVEPMALQHAACEREHVSYSDRAGNVTSICEPVTGSVSAVVTRSASPSRGNNGLDVVERIAAEDRVRSRARRHGRLADPEPGDHAPDQAAAAPAVRQRGEHELLVGHEQQQGLVAADRALVVEHRPPAEIAHPPAERVPAAECLSTRPVQLLKPVEMPLTEPQQVTDRRPEPTRGRRATGYASPGTRR